MAGSRQHLTCSFTPACLRCHTLVDTNVLLLRTVLLCAGPIRGCSAVLAVRTVDTAAVAFGASLVRVCPEEEQVLSLIHI